MVTKTIKAICVILGLVSIVNTFIAPPKNSGKVLAKDQTIKAVWAATLYSMDYPSKPTKDPESLKKDADALVKNAKDLGFNTIFLQVRPSGDAIYRSEIYPWSKYLTGEEGLAPDDGFDPLNYIIEKAHKEDIALHAWINPYRITASEKDADTLTDHSIAKKYPHLAVRHTDKKLYLDPGSPESINLVVDGCVEIAKNYQVDGIHIDDYFYPSSAFPDGETFSKYGGGFRDVGDWRRDNTKKLVETLGKEIKKTNPNLLFSVSPSGIWANKESHADGSETFGRQAYFDYYADTRLWVKEGLMDIIIPQLYWNIGYETADFEILANWWNDAVKGTNVTLCIGQGVYRVAEEQNTAAIWYGESGAREIEKQLEMIKSLECYGGYSQYRLGSILSSPHLKAFLQSQNIKKEHRFSDTKEYPWAEDAIERLLAKGVVKGMDENTFGPSLKVSRADFTVMLVRLSGQNVPFGENFADVTEDKYYYKEVGIAKVLGFATGREGNIFDPLGKISREDMATLAFRVMKRMGKLTEKSKISLEGKFSDANEISEYAKIAVSVLVEKKIITGYETGEFKPKENASRAECAVILDRLMEL